MVKTSRVPPFLVASSLALLGACNFQETKVDTDQGFGTFTDADLNYESVNDRIISPYCLSCHSTSAGNRGGINLESLEELVSQKSAVVRSAVTEKSMPPSSEAALPAEAIEMLDAWYKAGSPE